jgi:VIT1/CCC1 family predicted Fe2+/Mn2+ transporter
MKRLMRIHRYLSCFVAPAMLFFAVSGAWQAFRLHDTKKDGTYVAPQILQDLSQVHKAEKIEGAAATVFRAGQVLVALSFIVTAIIGVVMAFRITRPVWLIWICLLGGVALPTLLFLVARK